MRTIITYFQKNKTTAKTTIQIKTKNIDELKMKSQISKQKNVGTEI